MADAKITALSAVTTPLVTYVLPIIEDPGGTPVTKKITLDTLLTNATYALGPWEIAAPSSDFTLAASGSAQNVLPSACDVWTYAATTTYMMEGLYILNTGATTHTTAMSFVLGGGGSVTSFEYLTHMWMAAVNTTGTASTVIHVSGVASKVLNATSTAVYTIIRFNGLVRMNAAGTLTPQITFSANPTGTNLLKVGSYIRFAKVGANTVQATGGWG